MSSKNDKIKLHFDRFSFSVSAEAVKRLVLKEMDRLSKETGISIDHIPIEFYDNEKGVTIAYFQHCGTKPLKFAFHLNKFNGASANGIIDTVRHEFAHFVALVRKGDAIKPHGPEWKAICAELGAAPSPYADRSVTQHFIPNGNNDLFA